MNKILLFLALLIFASSMPAYIGEGVSNVFTITGTPVNESILSPIHQTTTIHSISPNPFRGSDPARVSLSVKAGEMADCSIYNLAGQLVKSRNFALSIPIHKRSQRGQGCVQ